MSKATLAVLLSRLKLFKSPKMYLEQYPTPSESAATILWDAQLRGLLQDKHILDLGAGTGILGIGALILGARKVTFVEIDTDASIILEENIASIKEQLDIELGEYTIITADITKDELDINADIVLSNPPFGTKQKGADTRFLEVALRCAPSCYSFHKSATDTHIQALIRALGATVRQKYSFGFNLPATMDYHEKKAHHVDISCFFATKDL